MTRKAINKLAREYLLCFIFLSVAFLFIIRPLLHDGFFPTFDDVQVVRVDEMTKELKSGQFPVRFVNDLGNGAGYSLFSFYPPLVYYLGALFHILGFTLVKSVKLVFILGYFVGGIGIFSLLKQYFQKYLAAIGTALFLTSPFLNYEVFTRGALAEFFGMSLFPFTFWLLDRYLREKNFINLLLFSIVLSLMILSHTFVGLFGVIILSLYVVLNERKDPVAMGFLGLLLGLSLSAWFWVPIFFQQKLTQYGQSFFAVNSFKTNFLSPLSLFGIFPPRWNFLPPLLGIGLFLGSILGIIIGIKKSIYKQSKLFLISTVCFIICIFLISPSSHFLWQSSKELQYMQFPWRFLVFLTTFSVILSIFFLNSIENRLFRIVLGISLLLINIFIYKTYLNPSSYNFISRYYAEDSCGTTTWAHEYLPKESLKCVPRSKDHKFIYPEIVVTAGLKINMKESNHGRSIFLQSSGEGGEVILRKYFAPGWIAKVDNEIVNITASKPYGLISFKLPAGEHKAEVKLEKTKIESESEILTALGTILLVTSFFLLKKHIIKNR